MMSSGFTQSPNEFFDVVLNQDNDLGRSELRLIGMVIRQTYGYHTQSVYFDSLGELCRVANISRPSAYKALEIIRKKEYLLIQEDAFGFCLSINPEAFNHKPVKNLYNQSGDTCNDSLQESVKNRYNQPVKNLYNPSIELNKVPLNKDSNIIKSDARNSTHGSDQSDARIAHGEITDTEKEKPTILSFDEGSSPFTNPEKVMAVQSALEEITKADPQSMTFANILNFLLAEKADSDTLIGKQGFKEYWFSIFQSRPRLKQVKDEWPRFLEWRQKETQSRPKTNYVNDTPECREYVRQAQERKARLEKACSEKPSPSLTNEQLATNQAHRLRIFNFSESEISSWNLPLSPDAFEAQFKIHAKNYLMRGMGKSSGSAHEGSRA